MGKENVHTQWNSSVIKKKSYVICRKVGATRNNQTKQIKSKFVRRTNVVCFLSFVEPRHCRFIKTYLYNDLKALRQNYPWRNKEGEEGGGGEGGAGRGRRWGHAAK